MSIKRPTGLGRLMDDLLDDNLPEERKKGASMVRISCIEPRSDQPRKTFDREALEVLADSIATYGVLQPIIVRENEAMPGLYEIIAGERRWRAAKIAGLDEIPAVLLKGDDLKIAQVALIENLQREDLDPVEEAMAYSVLIERFDLTQEQVAKQVGKSRSAIANSLRLLNLPEDVIEMLQADIISEGHAKALLGLNNPDNIVPLAQKIAEREMSVRETELAVKKLNAEKEEKDVYVDLNSDAGRLKLYLEEVEKEIEE